MKLTTLVALTSTALGFGIASQSARAATTLNFGNTQGGQIAFDGSDHFNFNPTGIATALNNSFKITGASAPSLAIGDFGTMSGPAGGWAFDHVTGVVTGTGHLDIEDFGGIHLTADLIWGALTPNGFGTGGTLNGALTFNLSNVAYLGADPDLAAFLGGGTETLSFTFADNTGHTLLNLGTVAQFTSFSGTLSPGSSIPGDGDRVPDGGTTAALLGFALVSTLAFRKGVA